MRKWIEFMGILEEEEHLVRMLKLVKKERDRLIKQDILKGGYSDLLDIWKDEQRR